MPGQRRTAGPRTRGSWLPRLAGLGVIAVLAGGGTAAYLVAFRPAQPQAASTLPGKVESYQTVGLIAEPAQGGGGHGGGALLQLLSADGKPEFTPVGLAQQLNGHPEWTADLMNGGAYIFIYLPTGQCLAASGRGHRAVLAVQRCDLGQRQRWRRLGSATIQGGHDFYQFANSGSGQCVAQVSPTGANPAGAGLTSCSPAHPASQLLAFWWTAE
jgi:hypothetical protein